MIKTIAILITLVVGGTLVDVETDLATKSVGAQAEEFEIDGGHSTVLFRVAHLDTAPFWGRFNKVEGSFALGGDGGFVNVKVDASSVDTNDEARDRHVKSQDFFSVKEFPAIEFKSTKVTATSPDEVSVTGALTFHGVTKEVSFKARHAGTREVGGRFGKRSGWEAELALKRSDFNMKYGIDNRMLGDDIRLVIALEGMK